MPSIEGNRVAIGVIRKPHGVKGGLKVTLFSIDLDRLRKMEQLFVNRNGLWDSLTLNSSQGYADYAMLGFEEIQDRTAAESYRNLRLYAEREEVPEPAEDEYYIDDLIGCDVVNTAGEILGSVSDVLTPGAHDVLVIRQDATEWMLPLVSEWVLSVDLDLRRIQVHQIEDVL